MIFEVEGEKQDGLQKPRKSVFTDNTTFRGKRSNTVPRRGYIPGQRFLAANEHVRVLAGRLYPAHNMFASR